VDSGSLANPADCLFKKTKNKSQSTDWLSGNLLLYCSPIYAFYSGVGHNWGDSGTEIDEKRYQFLPFQIDFIG